MINRKHTVLRVFARLKIGANFAGKKGKRPKLRGALL